MIEYAVRHKPTGFIHLMPPRKAFDRAFAEKYLAASVDRPVDMDAFEIIEREVSEWQTVQ